MTELVIVVPGIMGSELWLGDDLVWPGPVRSLWLPYRKMAELRRDDLDARDIIRSVSISVQYQVLLDNLATCGFRERADPPTLFVCPYDWRKANELAANTLAECIDRAAGLHGLDAEVTLVAHSMGGLVSRYYLESGDYANRPGFPCVRRLLTIGTPHRGAPEALAAVLGKEKRLFLNEAQVKELASDPRFPAAYQLLPPPGEPCTWNDQPRAQYATINIYDPEIARRLGLIQANLDAAQRFHARLDPARRPADVRYFCFAGTRQATVTLVRIHLERAEQVRPVTLPDAGDGTVPSWSSHLPGMQSLPVSGEHGTLYRAADVRRTTAWLLGKPEAAVLDTLPASELALRERVVEPRATVHAVLSLVGTVQILEGNLVLQRANATDESPDTFRPFTASYPVRYTGLAVETLGLQLRAPELPGVYRVAFQPEGQATPACVDELFVQQPST